MSYFIVGYELIEEVLQQVTITTTTTVTSQLDTSLVALVALILGVFSTLLSIALALLAIKDYFGRKLKARLNLIAPELREIRKLLTGLLIDSSVESVHLKTIVSDYMIKMSDFKGKGYWRVDLAKIDPKLMQAFDALHDSIGKLYDTAKNRFDDDEEQIEKYIRDNIKHNQIKEVRDRIDKLLERA